MGGFTADEDEGTTGRRKTGNCWASYDAYAKHKRAKSATERRLDNPGGAVSHSIHNNFNDPHKLAPGEKTCGAQSPLRGSVIKSDNKNASCHRASLENDIEQLQLRLQQERSTRMMLERAIGHASSTLSPGHWHLPSQTKDLIEEIELLEEEVANREQDVLSLYRSIFEHCVNQPPSEQSSGVTSPAHTKKEDRKHPSTISSAFCSAKHMQPFHVLASSSDTGKGTLSPQTKTRHASLLGGRANYHFEKASSGYDKAQEMLPTMEKTCVSRTLKDHLYHCPSKLSEDMVRCMASIYCLLRSSTSENLEEKRSPLLSRPSTIIPQCGINEDWSSKSMVEISALSTDKNNFSCASYAISNYRMLVEQMERVNVTEMQTNAQIAFWINIYNSLIMHAYLAYSIQHSSMRRLALFHKAAYNISGHIVNANIIEQSILGFRTPRVGRWFEVILSSAMRKRFGEERQVVSSKFSLPNSSSLVCFALCTGAFSDPMLKVYTPANVEEELEVAKRDYLQATVVVKRSKKVFLPKMLERFAKESSIPLDDLIRWVAENVDKKLRDTIQECIDHKTNRKASHVIEWLPYNSRFRYMFSEDLIEKPWWM
ncbi:hypothetical protein NMG60_11027324 [Bertholletia excelsa]